MTDHIYRTTKAVPGGIVSVTVKPIENGYSFASKHKPTHGSTEVLDAATILGLSESEARIRADKIMAGYVEFYTQRESA